MLFTLRKIIDYFTSNNSTVNVCAIDISKAFDSLDHDKLFLKLLDRHVPIAYILLLKCWYNKNLVTVQRGAAYSEFVKIKTGVRQGSVLSPYLFAVYVDKLLQKLKASGRGCHIKSFCFNSVMYADDLLLLSVSIMDMQMLINILYALRYWQKEIWK